MKRRLWIMVLAAAGILLPAAVRAGEGLQRIRDRLDQRRTLLAEQTLSVEKARARAEAADAAFAEALDLLDAGDAESVRRAFKRIGKGMKRLEQAAKAEGSADFEGFARTTQDELWDACSSMFLVGGATVPPFPPEEAPLYEKLGRKLKGALKKAGRGKLAKAVQKLAKAYPALLAINPDP